MSFFANKIKKILTAVSILYLYCYMLISCYYNYTYSWKLPSGIYISRNLIVVYNVIRNSPSFFIYISRNLFVAYNILMCKGNHSIYISRNLCVVYNFFIRVSTGLSTLVGICVLHITNAEKNFTAYLH